jgi:hypothetical protein
VKPLSFNMSKFKKIAGDKNHSVLRHDDGHEIKVAHGPLPALQRKQLEKMEVQHYDEGTSNVQSPPSPPSNPPATSPEVAAALKNAFKAEGGQVHRANNPKLQQSLVRNPPPASQQVLKENYRHDELPRFAEGSGDVGNDSSSAPDQSSQHTININVGQPQPLGQVPPIQGLSTPTGSPNVNVPSVAPSSVPLNPNQTVNFPQALKQEGQANTDIGKIQGAQQQANIPLEQQSQQIEQQRANAINNLAQQHINEFNQFAQELPDIDSNHYMNSMSAPGKIATALGVFLGSAPTGHGGSNTALDFLNKQIDRDVQMQIQNKDKVKNIYAAYEKLYGDSQAAVDMTKGSMLSIIGHQANIIANKLGTPMAQAQMNKLNAGIGQQQAQNARSAAFDAVMNTPSGAGKPISGGQPPSQSGPSQGMSAKEKEALDISNKNYGTESFKPDQIMKPGALNAALSLKDTVPGINDEAQQANQAEKFLNGVKGDGVGGIHDIYQKLYSESGSGKFGPGIAGATQRSGSGILAGLGMAAGEYIGGPMGAGIGAAVGSHGGIPAFTKAQKEYEVNRNKVKQELATSLHGLISVNDLDKFIDPYLPGFLDPPELVKAKEDALRDTVKKSLQTGHLQQAGLLNQ